MNSRADRAIRQFRGTKMTHALVHRHGRRPQHQQNSRRNMAFVVKSKLVLILMACFATPLAQAQTASFAFGQGGFAPTAYGSDGIFNECAGVIHGYGASECLSETYLEGGQGATLTQHQTLNGTAGYVLPMQGAAGAAASFNRYGNGASATTCALSQNNSVTNCTTGAYASAHGAFAKTSFGSARN